MHEDQDTTLVVTATCLIVSDCFIRVYQSFCTIFASSVRCCFLSWIYASVIFKAIILDHPLILELFLPPIIPKIIPA